MGSIAEESYVVRDKDGSQLAGEGPSAGEDQRVDDELLHDGIGGESLNPQGRSRYSSKGIETQCKAPLRARRGR